MHLQLEEVAAKSTRLKMYKKFQWKFAKIGAFEQLKYLDDILFLACTMSVLGTHGRSTISTKTSTLKGKGLNIAAERPRRNLISIPGVATTKKSLDNRTLLLCYIL